MATFDSLPYETDITKHSAVPIAAAVVATLIIIAFHLGDRLAARERSATLVSPPRTTGATQQIPLITDPLQVSRQDLRMVRW